MLETEIKNLTKQIEQLNSNFAKFFETQTADNSQTPSSPQVEEVGSNVEQTEEAKPSVTPESFRDLCMMKSRADRTLKPVIKQILAGLGAKVVEDLSPENLIKANEQVGAL